LAAHKVHAAYVPLDAGFPADRIGYICEDSGARFALAPPHLAAALPGEVTAVDPADEPGEDGPLTAAEAGIPADELAYLIYTSGTTGRPKGVAIEHASIVNFVRVAGELYGYRPGDRVYQGMTLAFDFSVEELWVPWVAGAAVVPKRGKAAMVGDDLQDFLRDNGITALACVPTLLATLDPAECTQLRFLLVSGEACPQDLVTRWHTEDRRFLNVYGPTEATVTATWTVVHPDHPVTIGRPLPTYRAVVLDPDDPTRLLEPGEQGELGIAGIGLAAGYLGLPDRTAAAFREDVPGIDRVYRTGDLVSVTEAGEIAYHGRIDTQVKLRGYRIELTEIESVLLGVAGVAQAVVDVWEPAEGVRELVAWYSTRGPVTREDLVARLRDRLPSYMVPAYLEELDRVPMTTSDKADRRNLPDPVSGRVVTGGAHVEPGTDAERTLAAALGGVLGTGPVSVTADLFSDLGANSLLLARFVTAAREGGIALTIREVYANPTVRELARVEQAPAVAAEEVREPHRASAAAYALTGIAQVLLFVGYTSLLAFGVSTAYDWVAEAGAISSTLLRAVAVGGLAFAALCLAPIVLKWVLVGRFREQEFPAWTWRYLRFWLVRTVIRANPLLLFTGSPVVALYLRALGARIGPRVLWLSRTVPVCPDLVDIGADTVVRKDAVLLGYRAEGGRIRTGRITLGERAFVGEGAVLDVDVEMGHHAQLAHASSLHAGQRVPGGESWHGTPARPAGEVDFRRAEPTRVAPWRRAVYGTMQVAQVLVIALPVVFGALEAVLAQRIGGAAPAMTPTVFVLDALVVGSAAFGALVLGQVVAALVLGRLLRRALRPGETYPIYGIRYSLLRLATRLTNRPLLDSLFGDSSAITRYTRALGYDLGVVEQTGSNFGTTQKHDTPFAVRIGRGTMISDGLSLANVEYTSSSLRVGESRLGERNFLGNNVIVPAGGRIGDNVLLATKVMVPLDGEVRSDTGLLGSPAFAIPRSVERDSRFDALATGPEFRNRLRRKNLSNTLTGLALLAVRWVHLVLVAAVGLGGALLYPALGPLAVGAAAVAALLVGVGWFTLASRAAMGFRRLEPRFCSIYDPYFWRHERLWKLLPPFLALFDGTPLKAMVLRALGVRVGKRLLDDGCSMPEHTLVTVGDHCTLGPLSTVQCHSLEDGTFKSDHTVLGAGVTIGTNAFVHYGVEMAENTVLDADAFLMKGTQTARDTRWQSNPASPT
ncbi:Pls/PosA family non-ribosomal peptide synthetase, partial [Pseudonocardia pini]|uniref:Pls/PosA family non-ribosomal peptide synthetase n=1 Tax=Pseudonocardia pini TaxID=2758030 RepID=UPI0015F0B5C7